MVAPAAETAAEPAIDQRRLRGEETRRQLVDAAIRSVATSGLGRTTLKSVADLAGVSQPLVIFHFKTKDQLLTAALDRALILYDESLAAACSQTGDHPRRRLEAIVTHDARFPKSRPDLLSLWFAVFGEARATPLYLRNSLGYDREGLREFRHFFERIGVAPADAPVRASLLNAAGFGLWLDAHLDPASYDPDRDAALMLTLLDRLIA